MAFLVFILRLPAFFCIRRKFRSGHWGEWISLSVSCSPFLLIPEFMGLQSQFPSFLRANFPLRFFLRSYFVVLLFFLAWVILPLDDLWKPKPFPFPDSKNISHHQEIDILRKKEAARKRRSLSHKTINSAAGKRRQLRKKKKKMYSCRISSFFRFLEIGQLHGILKRFLHCKTYQGVS